MASETTLVASRLVTRNPATGEVLAELECAGSPKVAAAVERARAAQPAWQQRGMRSRLGVVRKFQRLLSRDRERIARLVTRESGKPYTEALLTEVLITLDSAQFYLDQAFRLLREEPIAHGNLLLRAKWGRLLREPWGVVGIISPWNYPFSIPGTQALAALVAGNAVVLKPSEYTPLVALELARLLHEAGVPPQVFQVVVGEGPTGASLAESGVDKLIFTGSVATGRRVAQMAASRLLPVVLELGGKDPMLVLEDADLEVASSAAVWGAFVNAGQTCLAVERCYVHRSLYPRFLELCVQKTGRLRVGNGEDANTDVGPMIHRGQMEIVDAHVREAVAAGARLLAGGRPLSDAGANFYAPTVLADVRHDMRIMREETFGPVLPVMPFDSEEDAVRLANDSEFGLSASIWTRDQKRGEALARCLQAGTVMVNDAVACFAIAEAPHGGMKSSGLGRTHGRLGLEEMTRPKYVDSDRLPALRKTWWYHYGPRSQQQVEDFMDFLFSARPVRRLLAGVRTLGALWRKDRL